MVVRVALACVWLCLWGHVSGLPHIKVNDRIEEAADRVQLGVHGSPEFADLVKQGPRWAAVGSGQLTLDKEGWPQNDFEWVMDFRRNKPWNGPDFSGVNDNPAGSYYLSFQGKATFVSIGDNDSLTFVNQTYSESTGMTSLYVVFQPDRFLFVFQLTNTQRTSSAAVGSGLTNISMLRPGAAPGSKQLFTTRFVNVVKQLNPTDFRSFDSGINGYNIWNGANLVENKWQDRSLPSDAYWPLQSRNEGSVSGLAMPWEFFMQICIQTDTPGWFSLPIGADDDYFQNFALLLKNGNSFTAPYPANTPFYIEYSNEVWNWGFSQSIYNEIVAKKNNVTALENYIYRSFEISNIFRKVFGDAAMGSIVRVVGLWQYNNWVSMQETLLAAQAKFGAPAGHFMWGIGEAPYVNPLEDGYVPYSAVLDPNGVDRIMDSFYTSAGERRQAFTAWQTVATFFGMYVVGYESGPSLVGGIESEVSRSPRMKDFEARYFMENYFATGAKAVNFFALGPGGPGPYGDWYMFEHWGEEQSFGKFQGFLAVSGQPEPELVVGYVLPWAQNQQISIDASQDSAPYGFGGRDHLPGSNIVICATGCWPHPAVVNYLLRSTSSGSYKVVLVGTASTAASNMIVWLDNMAVQTVTFPTGNTPGNVTVNIKIPAAGLYTLAFSTTTAGNSQLRGVSIFITMTSGSGTAVKPSAPLNVIGSSLDKGAKLLWDLVSTATSYNVLRATTTGGPYSKIATALNNSYVDSGLQNDVRYYYVVTAENSVGQSALSPQIVIVPVQQVAPAAPQVKISSGVQHGSSIAPLGQAYLQWQVVPNTISYTVTRSTSPSGANKATMGPTTGLSLYEGNLQPGATYYYNVTATNPTGTSVTSVSIAIPTTSVPGTPTGLTVNVVNGVVTLNWLQALWTWPEFAELFIVERGTSSAGPFAVVEAVSTNNFQDFAADKASNNCYRVWGNSGNGKSAAPSNVVCSQK